MCLEGKKFFFTNELVFYSLIVVVTAATATTTAIGVCKQYIQRNTNTQTVIFVMCVQYDDGEEKR